MRQFGQSVRYSDLERVWVKDVVGFVFGRL